MEMSTNLTKIGDELGNKHVLLREIKEEKFVVQHNTLELNSDRQKNVLSRDLYPNEY